MIETIGVVGAGTMGGGIAQVAARAGHRVLLRDVAPEFLERGMRAIDRSLQRDVDKERLKDEEKREIVGRIETTTELRRSARPTIVEAVGESSKSNRRVFAISQAANPEAILASNTSSSSSPAFAGHVPADRVKSEHFRTRCPDEAVAVSAASPFGDTLERSGS